MRSNVFKVVLAAMAAVAVAAGAAVTPAMAGQAHAPSAASVPLSAYGALPSMELVTLSPSGRRLALITVIGEQRSLALLDMEADAALGRVGIGMAKVRGLQWIGENRILITTSSMESMAELGVIKRELFSGQIYDLERRRIVGVLAGEENLFPALMSEVTVVTAGQTPEILVRAHSFIDPGRLDLYRIDPATGRARQAERMSREVDDFVLNAAGQSLARGEYDERSQVWSLHLRQNGTFQETWRTPAPVDRPSLIGLGMTADSVIVAADRPDLHRDGHEDADFFDVNLATGAWRAVRFEFNPTGLWFHPVTGLLIGASRMEDGGRRYAFADPDAGTLWAAAEQTFTGGAPALISMSDDMQSAVVFTSGADDSGTYHLLDLKAASVTPVGQAYADVPGDQVATVTALSYPAADGLEIHGYLTTPRGVEGRNLPLVVLAHGGPASRDVMEFDWWAQALASRGYAVLQANFRGSTGYGEAFMEAGYGEWGRKMQTDLSDGVHHLVEQGIVDPRRVCIVGASYGGYAALAGPTLDQGVYRCAVSVAGVSDLRRMVDYAANRGERRDNASVRYWNRFMGGDSPGDRSLDARSPARLAAQADAPILLLHGRDDTVVPIEQSRLMAAALRRAGKPVEFIELDGEDHWLSRGETRTRMLEETVKFLEANNPAD